MPIGRMSQPRAKSWHRLCDLIFPVPFMSTEWSDGRRGGVDGVAAAAVRAERASRSELNPGSVHRKAIVVGASRPNFREGAL